HGSPVDALEQAAHETGASFGREARRAAGPHPGRRRLLEEAEVVLQRNGFEPRLEGANSLALGNCPFSPLAGEYIELVCGANLALMEGLASGLRVKGVQAVSSPAPGRCCVAFQPTTPAAAGEDTATGG